MSDRPPPTHYQAWPPETRHTPPRRNWWSILAFGTIISLVIAGLAVVGAMLFYFFALAQYGSNK